VFRDRLRGEDLSAFVARFDEGGEVVTGDLVASATLLREVGPVEGLGRLVTKVDPEGGDSPAAAAATLEFVLDGLWLTRRLSKAEIGGRVVYGAA